MAIDLTGGLDGSREHVFAQRPDNPEMRDSVSMWISDDRGELGIPRVGIEAVASAWETHSLQLNVAFPDGRVYRARDSGKALSPLDDGGLPTILGAGPLAFRSFICSRSRKLVRGSAHAAARARSVIISNTCLNSCWH